MNINGHFVRSYFVYSSLCSVVVVISFNANYISYFFRIGVDGFYVNFLFVDWNCYGIGRQDYMFQTGIYKIDSTKLPLVYVSETSRNLKIK